MLKMMKTPQWIYIHPCNGENNPSDCKFFQVMVKTPLMSLNSFKQWLKHPKVYKFVKVMVEFNPMSLNSSWKWCKHSEVPSLFYEKNRSKTQFNNSYKIVVASLGEILISNSPQKINGDIYRVISRSWEWENHNVSMKNHYYNIYFSLEIIFPLLELSSHYDNY